MLLLSLVVLVSLLAKTADAVSTGGGGRPARGSCSASAIFDTYGSAPTPHTASAAAGASQRRARSSGVNITVDCVAKQSRSTRSHAAATLRSLPEVGFSDEPDAPWLGAIQAGLKTRELRLDTHPATANLTAGDSFLGVSPYRKLELRITAVTEYNDFGSAWLTHGDALVPPQVSVVRSAAEAHQAYQSFYKHEVRPRPGRCRVFHIAVVRTLYGTPPSYANIPARQRPASCAQ